jgi:hypothetical protein
LIPEISSFTAPNIAMQSFIAENYSTLFQPGSLN